MTTEALGKRVRREEAPQRELRVGDWYWVRTDKWGQIGVNEKDDTHRFLCCLTHVGTNHAEFDQSNSLRVHFDEFDARCEHEPDAEAVIKGYIQQHSDRARALMAEVQELTARLGVAPRLALDEGDAPAEETQALSTRTETPDAYKKALQRAAKEQLPELFKKIREEHDQMKRWMKAQLVPQRAAADRLEGVIEKVKKRILGVELYAGLIENVEAVRKGAPAAVSDPVRLHQRRAYMDEECLARYEAGGMEFGDIGAFDAWLARPENADRLLPGPRCVVAFQVRRHDKERDLSIADMVSFGFKLKKLDQSTFLYIRNGERIYRLDTGTRFEHRLFPDLDRSALDGVVYADVFAGRASGDGLLTEGDYEAEKARYLESTPNDWRSDGGRYYHWDDFDRKRPIPEAKVRAARKERAERVERQERDGVRVDLGSSRYVKWDRGNVFYDDIAKVVAEQAEQHNRLVTVLQGLLDRSEVFHPHPPWQLWTPDGFAAALRLVYDDSRALTTGDRPDFEAYRARLNASLRRGSTCVGQQDAWLEREAERENARQQRDWRVRNKSDYRRFKPDGNDGPGRLAVAARVTRKGAEFEWTRLKRTARKAWVENPRRPGWGHYDRVHDSTTDRIAVPLSRLLHVDAYRPGDFRQFFDDPRTRADYLRWAPLLLAAEDWHAERDGAAPKKAREK